MNIIDYIKDFFTKAGKWIIGFGFLLASVAFNCCPNIVAPIPTPVVPSDYGYCHSGCEAAKKIVGRDGKMGCEESRDLVIHTKLDGGVDAGFSIKTVTCEQWCNEEEQKGVNLQPSCWTQITSCDQIDEFRKSRFNCIIDGGK